MRGSVWIYISHHNKTHCLISYDDVSIQKLDSIAWLKFFKRGCFKKIPGTKLTFPFWHLLALISLQFHPRSLHLAFWHQIWKFTKFCIFHFISFQLIKSILLSSCSITICFVLLDAYIFLNCSSPCLFMHAISFPCPHIRCYFNLSLKKSTGIFIQSPILAFYIGGKIIQPMHEIPSRQRSVVTY